MNRPPTSEPELEPADEERPEQHAHVVVERALAVLDLVPIEAGADEDFREGADMDPESSLEGVDGGQVGQGGCRDRANRQPQELRRSQLESDSRRERAARE